MDDLSRVRCGKECSLKNVIVTLLVLDTSYLPGLVCYMITKTGGIIQRALPGWYHLSLDLGPPSNRLKELGTVRLLYLCNCNSCGASATSVNLSNQMV